MEEIEHSIVHALESYAKFIDPVVEIISLGSPELMSLLTEQPETDHALRSRLGNQAIKPRLERN